MKRRVLSLLVLLSLAACAAVSVLWVRSYWRFDGGLARRGRQVFIVSSVAGQLRLTWGTERNRRNRLEWDSHPIHEDLRAFGRRALVTFDARREVTWPGGEVSRSVRLPHWALAAVAGLPPAYRLVRRRRNGVAFRAALCTRCGYDLRATPDRCPECGTIAPASAAE